MRLSHLALSVRDQQRSRRFYETYFGFDAGPAQRYDDGVLIIRNADGFDLALAADPDPGPLPPFVHFGFRLADPAAVRALLARVVADGVVVVEQAWEPTLVSFKCLDPDGYVVEVYWE
jgi:catechol 2,3-dioxygenase-like lactoylglutathione lyase family enzyme